MRKIYIAGAALIVSVAACKKSTLDITSKDLALNATEQQQVQASNAFTFNLFKQENAKSAPGENIMLSPLSVGMAMSMTANGANGQTLDEIHTGLSFTGFNSGQINNYYHDLMGVLPNLDPQSTLSIANSIWYRNTLTPLNSFLQIDKDSYNAGINAVDFSNPSTVTQINNWVSGATNGKIPSIIDNIPGGMMMYLINAVYFKGAWQYKFDKSQTAKGQFTLADGSTKQVDMMNNTAPISVGNFDNASICELPYGNGKYTMVMVLPQSGSLNDLVNSIDTAKWNKWTSHLTTSSQYISMPKFTFSYADDLIPSLTNLGIGLAFTPQADFSALSGQTGLFISQVKHKAYIAVDEEGTEAAAATSVGISTTSFSGFIINRPFFFAIREKKSGLIIFSGIVNDPTLTD